MSPLSEVHAEIDVSGIVVAFSDALDLVGGGVARHGKRVAYIAAHLAAELDLPAADREDAFLAAMIHDCGVSSSRMMARLLGADAEPPMEEDELDGHCEKGAALLAGFWPLQRLSRVVRHHHAPWERLSASDVDPSEALLASIVRIADHADVLLRGAFGRPLADGVPGEAHPWSSGFAPGLAEAFRAVSAPPAFWFGLSPAHLDSWVAETRSTVVPRMQPVSSLRPLAGIFAHVVDAKSPYTADHSVRVARLARHLGELAGLAHEELEDLEIAGLLHDLGKLGVPDEILEKDGPLSPAERSIIERHPYETYQILRRVDVFRSIAGWAAWHHEQPNGKGYPFALSGGEIPLPARIVAVADGFQALAADRPYRRSMSPEAAMARLTERARAGELDSDVVHALGGALEECVEMARGGGNG